jgi:hypothetical protein
MGPTNDHELAIAIAVGNLAKEGKLRATAIEDVIAVLHFTMSKADSEFLVKFIRWRMDNPIAR